MPPQNPSRKHAVKKAELMLYKPLFITHVVKCLLKSYTVAQNESSQLQKLEWHTILIFYKNTWFQVSMQINDVLLYSKK